MTEKDVSLVFDCTLYFIEKMAYFKNQKQMTSIFDNAGLQTHHVSFILLFYLDRSLFHSLENYGGEIRQYSQETTNSC